MDVLDHFTHFECRINFRVSIELKITSIKYLGWVKIGTDKTFQSLKDDACST